MSKTIPFVLALMGVAVCAAPAFAGDKEWAKGVPYTTDWKDAIRQAHATGKILLIYNGWEREKI